MTAQEKVISIAKAEIGYMGHKTNAYLDKPQTNIGGKYTKYARDLDTIGFYNGKKNGYDWCDVFVDWCYVKAFGMDLALTITGQKKGGLGAGCGYSRKYFEAIGRQFTTPQIGDQVFFSNDGGKSCYHTGLVINVTGSYVYTIEGNSTVSGYSTYGVAEHKYAKNNKYIYRYGRPLWNLVPVATTPAPTVSNNPSDKNTGMEEKELVYYETLKDVPPSYKDTITKLLQNGTLKGSSDPDPARIDDNVLHISDDFCRIMTVLDRNGLIKIA